MRSLRVAVLVASAAAVSPLSARIAAADPAASLAAAASPAAEDRTSIGLRVGGYGFRREGDARVGEGWTECPMDGVGVFGQRRLRGPLFVEVGLDGYTSQTFPIDRASTDLPIDRMSGLVSGAVGARARFASWMNGYVQIGGGAELTRVSVPYGDQGTIRANKVLPEGFIGAGFDIRFARGLYGGASIRLLGMGNFDYDPKRLQMGNAWVAAPPASSVFAASPDFAMQGQFYLRHSL